MSFNRASQPILYTDFHHKHQMTNAWHAIPTDIYIVRLGKTKKKVPRNARCAMVEGPEIEPRSCDYQSHVLTNCTIPPYKVLFICPRKHPARVSCIY